jgi:hypothetical protein
MYAIFENKELRSDIKFTLEDAFLRAASIIVLNPTVETLEIKQLLSYNSATDITWGRTFFRLDRRGFDLPRSYFQGSFE